MKDPVTVRISKLNQNALTVRQQANSNADLVIDAGNATRRQPELVLSVRGTPEWFIGDSNVNPGAFFIFDNQGSTSTPLVIEPTAAGSATNSALYVRNTGNVGIGTGSPTEKLHVVGSGFFTGDVDAQRGDFVTGLTVSGLPVSTATRTPYEVTFFDGFTAENWANMGAASAFLNDAVASIHHADLTGFSQTRLLVNKRLTAGAANSALFLRASTSYSDVATNYTTISTPETTVAINVAGGFLDSGWKPLKSQFAGEVFLAVVGSGGDGVTDPNFGSMVARFR